MSTPSDLFGAATSISTIALDEPLIRAAISRFYYCAYHRCFDFHVALPRPGRVGTSNGRHEQLISQLSNPDPKMDESLQDQSSALGKSLRFIYAKRIDSDYYLDRRLGAKDLSDVSAKTATIFAET